MGVCDSELTRCGCRKGGGGPGATNPVATGGIGTGVGAGLG